jgi:predicted nucleotidyltransferase
MQAIGLISEYNPFHNGHKYHLEEAKRISKNQNTICIMSGNFTQRGDVTITDKWTRATMAVNAGVDLVIELPTVFAVRSAQHFAAGSIRLLNALGVVKEVCFGAENAEYHLLNKIANASTDIEVIKLFHENLLAGKSYAAAMSSAISSIHGIPTKILSSPNNILATEYIKAINKYDLNIAPIPINRIIANYHDTEISHTIASATAIRTHLQSPNCDISTLKSAMPAYSFDLLKTSFLTNKSFPCLNNLSSILLYRLRTMNSTDLEKIIGISEGLENKLLNHSFQATDLERLLMLTKTKRYPLSRLQRILIHLMLGTTKETIDFFDKTGPLYARILAFNDRGRQIIKVLKKTSTIPLIGKTTNYLNTTKRNTKQLNDLEKMLAIDTYATDIYALAYSPNHSGGLDFIKSPLYIK